MLGPLTGLPLMRKQYIRIPFLNGTAYVHKGHVHYRFRGATPAERDQRAREFAAAYDGYTKELPGKPGLIARIDGDLRTDPTHPEE